MSSGSFQFSVDDFVKVFKGFMLSCGGCLIAFAAAQLALVDNSTVTGAVIAAAGATLLNLLRKWVVDNGGKVDVHGRKVG